MPEVSSPAINFATTGDGPFRVGAAVVSITPDFPVYLAGGLPYRLALSVHDDLTARAIVIESGGRRIALVSLDLIGINYDDVVRIRESITEEESAIDYVLIAATHTHNGPDVIGIWSPDTFCVESGYAAFLRERVREAVARAASRLREATLHVAQGDSGAPRLSRDTRDPNIIDDTLTVWQARDAASGEAIVTSIHYAAHPILIPSFNFEVSCDFPYWLREAVESGNGSTYALGGVCVFFNGALGGRIVPANVPDIAADSTVASAHERAKAYGDALARRAVELFESSAAEWTGPIELRAASTRLDVPVENLLLNSAMRACVVNRAIQIDTVHSEVAIVGVGPIEFFAAPGMLMPELVTGEFLIPPNVDFPDAPHEPTIGSMTTGQYPVVIGLANDMLGYLIPRSLWDAVAPYSTVDGGPPYGEVVSAGPDTAAVVMDGFMMLANDGVSP